MKMKNAILVLKFLFQGLYSIQTKKNMKKTSLLLTGISLLLVQNIIHTSDIMVGSFLARKVTKNIDVQRGATIGTVVALGIGTVICAGVGAL